MKSRWFIPIALLAAFSFVLAACGPAATAVPAEPAEPAAPAPADAPAAEAPSTELEGEVSIIAWAGYVERGETDPNYDWVTQFEADTSCTVSVKTAATSDEMVALMNEAALTWSRPQAMLQTALLPAAGSRRSTCRAFPATTRSMNVSRTRRGTQSMAFTTAFRIPPEKTS